ncbi:kinase-like protein [Heliocybe sulcata]|uniref:Kinase-like protein n=1 Tax=Heliocybe sulcata TaxID=5364 RepID=A0A5C3MR94_9AGAM|nr:kinase-like protein [Heliocybe sulcata]
MLSGLKSIFRPKSAAIPPRLRPPITIRNGTRRTSATTTTRKPKLERQSPRTANYSQNDTVIIFPEEPIGISAEDGFGHLELTIGDELGDRGEYKLARKLGYGRYSTVWLARPTRGRTKGDSPYFTAMKVLSQHATGRLGSHSDELRVLQRISNPTTSHKGKDFCTTLWDAFVVDGSHQALVLDLMAGDVKALRFMYKNGVMPLAMTKTIIGQMLVALQYLHDECRVVHADLRPENILIANPYPHVKLKQMLALEKPEYSPPMTVFGREVQPIVSKPLLSAPLFPFFQLAEHQWLFRLGDFGEAQFIDDKVTDCTMPDGLRAPEVIMGHPWDEKIDIWALGCLTHEFLTGRSVLDDSDMPSARDDRDLTSLALMIRSTGQRFPDDMLDKCNPEKVAQYFGPDSSLEDLANYSAPASIVSCLQTHNPEMAHHPHELESAAAFISRCLALRPGDRPCAAELLKDPWLMSEPVWGLRYETDPANASKEETLGAMVRWFSSPYLGVVSYMTLLLGTAVFVWELIS